MEKAVLMMAKKVLIVEDDSNIAELLNLYLEKEGFEPLVAKDGGKGVEQFRAFQPDLVLLDIMLPVMDGWSVLKKIRESSKVPVIMLTAKGETSDKVSGLEMGADDYIVKPFEMKEVLARIHAVLRRTAGGEEEGGAKKLAFDKLVINLDSYELIVNGQPVDTPPKELELLPLGAKIITLELAVRFLTDYLDGDRYFRVAYPEHNLVRARAQMKLVADMEAHWDEMQAIVAEEAAKRN